jgi:hypothetical protein
MLNLLLIAVWSDFLPAFAQSSSQDQRPVIPGLGPLLIILGICWWRRKKPIGGWLLCFFVYVFVGSVMAVVVLMLSVKGSQPAALDDPKLYALFLLSTVPYYVVRGVLLAFAIALLRTRAWKWVQAMKFALGVDIFFLLTGLAIDAAHFPGSALIDMNSLLSSSAFLAYLFASKRVKRVFKTKDWPQPISEVPSILDGEPQKGIIYTPSELEAMKDRVSKGQ